MLHDIKKCTRLYFLNKLESFWKHLSKKFQILLLSFQWWCSCSVIHCDSSVVSTPYISFFINYWYCGVIQMTLQLLVVRWRKVRRTFTTAQCQQIEDCWKLSISCFMINWETLECFHRAYITWHLRSGKQFFWYEVRRSKQWK